MEKNLQKNLQILIYSDRMLIAQAMVEDLLLLSRDGRLSAYEINYWANRELGISMAKLSRRMNASVMAVSYAVQRGEKIAREFNFSL
ncbi:MAG: hypothetical protein V3R49_07455 [Gammaproteobacteria bacterium]